MRQLSMWASAHRGVARLTIIGAFLLLNALGILLAVFLFNDKASGASWLIGSFVAITITGAVAYPAKGVPDSYWRRKRCEAALVLATFLFAVGNTANELRSQPANNYGLYANAAFRMNGAKSGEGLHYRLHRLRDRFQEMSTVAKILLCILIAAVAALAGTLIVFASCELACAGNGALAALLAIVGLGGIIAGGFLLIRRIFRGPRWFQKKQAQVHQSNE